LISLPRQRSEPTKVESPFWYYEKRIIFDLYYYLDWLEMSLSLLTVGLLGSKSRWGFACFVVANLTWLVVGSIAGSYGIVLGNVAFLVMNTRGFFRWKATASCIVPAPGAIT
jgi:hypothetical protein